MTSSDLIQLQQRMRICRLCIEAGHLITPGAVFSGGTGARVMIIGQAPGSTEVQALRPFNAGSGRRLFRWLSAAGWEESDFRRQHYMTAVTKCYPGKNSGGRGDRVPSKAEQALCRPYLDGEIKFIAPRLIIPVGGLAIRLYYSQSLNLKEVIGTAKYLHLDSTNEPMLVRINHAPSTEKNIRALPGDGTWIVPLPHPSGASIWPNKRENRVLIDSTIEFLRRLRIVWEL